MSDRASPLSARTMEPTADGGVIRFERVEAPMLLEHTHVDPGTYMRWELEPVESGCVLRLSHFVTDTARAIDNCYVVGLHASMARLGPCLAGRPVAWDWDAFAVAQAQYAGVGLAPAPSAT